MGDGFPGNIIANGQMADGHMGDWPDGRTDGWMDSNKPTGILVR